MKLSSYFFPLLKEIPAEVQVKSHQLMLRSGMICQESAGIYSWLPLGVRVLSKVADIVREEQSKIDCHEILMPTLQPAELWKASERYEAYGKEMLRIQDRHGRELLYSPTNEEMVTEIFKRFVKSYRQLPCRLFQIQWKFRDEIRPRFGVMRGREFLMKDAYSFDIDEAAARRTYDAMMRSYLKIFARMDLKAIPVRADSGPIGGDLSHEFHILAETGESTLYYDQAFEQMIYQDTVDLDHILSVYAMADEMHKPETCPVPSNQLKVTKGIEVGHIFNLKTKYSDILKAFVAGSDGKPIAPNMGCYGIGIGRVVAAIIEAHHDDRGICWPASVAPFQVGLLNLKRGDAETDRICEEIYTKLQDQGLDVLYDDRPETPGVKFSTMDLIGLPKQIIIGPKGLAQGIVEVKDRKSGEIKQIPLHSFVFHDSLIP